MDSKLKLIAQSFGSDRVLLDELVSDHVATKLGGPAKLFFVATNVREIIKMFQIVRELKLPFLMVGTGSKMAISDLGFNGVVIKNRTSNIVVVGVKGKVSKVGIGVDEAVVEAESGVTIQKLIEFLEKQGLDPSQIGNISGTIGGNLFINRYLQELVSKIKVLDSDGDLNEVESKDLRLQRHIILSAVFKFKTKR